MSELEAQRATNIWEAFARKLPPVPKSTRFQAVSEVGFDQIGGLDGPKEEMLTYACAATDPEVYSRWGTFPPSALLLVGPPASGKTLLAEAFASHTRISFLEIAVPRLVLQVMHMPKVIPELIQGWGEALDEMPPTAVFFDELEFTQLEAYGGLRPDLPVGPMMDFLLELVDRLIGSRGTLVMGSTSHPDGLRPPFLAPGRFERVVGVSVVFPDDVVAALRIHASHAEKRAGRPLFGEVDWEAVVRHEQAASIGDWVRLLHAVLRSKARCEAASEPSPVVTTEDLMHEAERSQKATNRLPRAGGRYL